jgi:hypothetical protein
MLHPKSTFSCLLERSAEVLALYSGFQSLLIFSGLLNNLGLSSEPEGLRKFAE